MAAEARFQVGIVTNGYWATEEDDAVEWLRPFKSLIQDLSVSSDLYHWDEKLSRQASNARAAAKKLRIPSGIITVAQCDGDSAGSVVGQLPPEESAVMYRGRATERLTQKVKGRPWTEFTACTRENLRDPQRVHVDPLGYVHLCQGISLGNLFHSSLKNICENYDAEKHPIVGPLIAAGPAELVRRYDLPHRDSYADACHLCYDVRSRLRDRFPEILGPDQMYGVGL
jgi:MoaA/NifB/PqqE/SkfB family radical SAM enzyme